MNKEVVIVAPSATAADEIAKALEALDDVGQIELYAAAVVTKAADGTVRTQTTRHTGPLWGAVVGTSLGALVGMLGGPVGAAVGASIGAAVGSAPNVGRDIVYSGFAGDFVQRVSSKLKPNMAAVCASIWEDWTEPLDGAVAPHHGEVFRQSVDELVIAQMRADVKALDEEAEHIEAEIERATEAAKTELEAKQDELRAKQKLLRARLEERAHELQATWEANIASIKQKVVSARASAKARHERHAEKLARFAAAQKRSFQQLLA